jgi:hypothetical protein
MVPDGDHRLCHIPSNLRVINSAVRVLNEIEKSWNMDIEQGMLRFGAGDPKDPNPVDSFSVREVWRIGSYIVFACTLELVLLKDFRDLLARLKSLSVHEYHTIKDCTDQQLTARRAETADVFEIRNKVFGHTSFGSPQQDSRSLQLTSLEYLTGNGVFWGPDGLTLGALTIGVEGQEVPYLPQMSMARLTSLMGPHLNGWLEMYRIVMGAMFAISDDHIKEKWKWVERVGRFPPIKRTP